MMLFRTKLISLNTLMLLLEIAKLCFAKCTRKQHDKYNSVRSVMPVGESKTVTSLRDFYDFV